MKSRHTLFIPCVAALLFFSCQSDDIAELQQNFQGHWELTRKISSWYGEMDPSNISTYHFRTDGTFLKTDPGLGRQVSGEFVQVPKSEKDWVLELILNFNPDLTEEDKGIFSGIVIGEPGVETLYLMNDGNLWNYGPPNIADGNVYVYERKP